MIKNVSYLKLAASVIASSIVSIILVLFIMDYVNTQQRLVEFASQGKRFTAINGQELCTRIAVIETHLKLPIGSCTYHNPEIEKSE
jgi:hypothetical protein